MALFAMAIAVMTATPAVAGEPVGAVFKFNVVRNLGLNPAFPGFLPSAHGCVKIENVDPVEIMDVTVSGLPPNTVFDFFVIQVPKTPFGLAWYQGEIERNDFGASPTNFINSVFLPATSDSRARRSKTGTDEVAAQLESLCVAFGDRQSHRIHYSNFINPL